MFRQRNPTDPTKARRRIFRGTFSSRHPLEGRTRAVSFSAWRGRNPKRRKTARPTSTTTGLFNRRIWRSLVKVKQRDDCTNEKLLRFRCDHYTIVYIFLYVYVYVMYLPVYVQYMIVSICVSFETNYSNCGIRSTISNGFTASRMDLEIGGGEEETVNFPTFPEETTHRPSKIAKLASQTFPSMGIADVRALLLPADSPTTRYITSN